MKTRRFVSPTIDRPSRSTVTDIWSEEELLSRSNRKRVSLEKRLLRMLNRNRITVSTATRYISSSAGDTPTLRGILLRTTAWKVKTKTNNDM
jgi:hypothetical protein